MKYAVLLICAFVLAVAKIPSGHAETVLRIEYHPDPCQLAAAYGKKQQAQVGGVKLSYETFYYAVCEKVRESIVESISARANQLRGDLEEEARTRIDKLYQGVHSGFGEMLYSHLPPEQQAAISEKAYFAQWLKNPNRDTVELYVNYYFHEHFSFVAEQLKAYQDDTSREIVSGLGELWDKAKKRLQDIVSAKKEIDASPDTPVTDILKKYGLSGEWIDRLQGYEGRFDRLNKQYSIIDTARTIHGAFTAETYSGRIEGMFSLMEKFGGMLSDSNVPGVSLMGTLIEAYGQLAREALARANELENTIRQREGYCIGLAAHSLDKKRQFAFVDLVGQGIRACPLDTEDELLRDIYVQAQPQDAGQLYFWRDGHFIKGIEGGGGAVGLQLVRDYIRSAATIHVSELAGKENDLATIISFYNTPYTKENFLKDLPGHQYRTGFQGLVSEADSVIDAIRAAVLNLEQQARLDEACGKQDFERMILNETTLRLGAFPASDYQELQKLKLSYVLGYVRIYGRAADSLPVRQAGYRTYSRVWRRLKDLSMVILSGEVLRKGGDRSQCPNCAGAAIDLAVAQGSELPGCEVTQSDEKARFTARIVTRSPQMAVTMSARAGDAEGEQATVDARHLGLEGVSPPFARNFQVNLFLPSDVDEADLESRLSALRELDARSAAVLAEGRNACGSGRQLAGDIEAGKAALSQPMQFLQGAFADTSRQIEGMTDFAARLERDVLEGQRLGLSATEVKQEAERLAGQVCAGTQKLRDTSEAETREALFENLRILVSSLHEGKASLDEDASAAANLADGAEAELDRVLATIETLAGVERNLAILETERSKLDADIDRMRDVWLRLETSVQELTAISARADDLAGVIGRLSDAMPDDAAARFVAEAESLRSVLAARVRELAACETSLKTVLDDAVRLQSDVAEVSRRYRELSGRVGAGGKIAGPGETYKTRVGDIRASANVAEIMADAASSALQEADRCFEIAGSAMTSQQDDDLAAAAAAALDTCDFKAARTALEKMGQGDIRAQLADRYRAAVSRERNTNDLFERANAEYGEKRYDQALSLLEQARANTRCDSYRDRIALSIATIRAEWGNSVYEETEAAIDACDFTRAKQLLESPALEDHPGRGIIASAYTSAYEREKHTNDLWSRASEALRQGEHSQARALLTQAGENTRCSRYRDRIRAALAQIPQARPDVPAKPDKGVTSEVAPSGRTRPVFQSLEEARARCKQMGFDLARKNPDGPGFICGKSKAPPKPKEQVYYDYKQAKKACDRRNMLTVPHVELGKKSRGWVCFPKFQKRVLDNVPTGN